MAQTFKEKLAELEAKRRFEQEAIMTSGSEVTDAIEILETSEFPENPLSQNDVEHRCQLEKRPKLK